MIPDLKLEYTDSNHAYYVDGKRWSGVTTTAKIPTDSFALDQWRKRQVVIGLTKNPQLIESAAVDLDNRELINGIADKAITSEAAERGTQMHRVLELVATGQEDKLITEQQRSDAARLRRTLDAYDIELLPEFVEQFVVWPEHRVCGRLDGVVCWQGKLYICDLKSSRNAVKYPDATANQLAMYADAPQCSARIDTNGDRSTVTAWRELPDLGDVGLILSVTPDDEVGELWQVDLNVGRRGYQLAFGAKKWRWEAKKCATKIAAPSAPSQPDVEQPPAGEATAPSAGNDRREQLLVRYRDLAPADQARFKELNVPSDDLDAIEAALDQVDPFMVVHPPQPRVRKPIAAPQGPDDGEKVAEAVVSGIISEVEGEHKAVVNAWLVQSRDAGASFDPRHKRLARQVEITRAAVWLARATDGDDELARVALTSVLPEDRHTVIQPAFAVGQVLGVLTLDEATALANLGQTLVEQIDGTPSADDVARLAA